ncbi:Thaumatin-like protein 1 [Linum perenne]
MDPHILLFLLLSTSSLSGSISTSPPFQFPIPYFFLLLIVSFPFSAGIEPAATFKITNRCRQTIWPGLLSGANTAQLPTTGFPLHPGKSRSISIPSGWSGRIWGRTHCTLTGGKFSCLTADCGSEKVECAGSGAKPPATLVDFYDVSLVDGYNLPMLVYPKKVTRGGCGATGCLIDLNGACPRDLKVMARVGCRSACEAFGDPTCGPSDYSLFFKHACPRSYSYAYDDKTSTYTCADTDYVIVFCPHPYTRCVN